MSYVEVNGTRLWYEEEGAGAAVVFLHEGLLDRRMWAPQVPAFSPRFRTIRFDFRGYGRSDPPAEPYAQWDDLRGLLDALGVDRAALVGGSMGGKCAIDFTLTWPERAWALVAMAPGLSGFSFRAYDDAQNARAKAAWEAGDLARLADIWLEVWAPLGDEGFVGEIARDNAGVFRYEDELDLEPPAVDRLGEIRTPTLVVAGDQDVEGIRQICELLEERVEGARRVVLSPADHMPNIRQPDEFNRVVLEFLESVAPPSP